MRTQDVKIRTICSAFAVWLSAVSATLGQTPQTQPPANSINIVGFDWQTHEAQNASPQSVSRNINVAPETPEEKERGEQRGVLNHAAAVSLHAGRYAEAEVEARQALSLGLDSGATYGMLGAALAAQGKTQEALQVYHAMVDGQDRPVGQTRYLLPYALLLLKSGQWAHAVAAYNAALPLLDEGELMRANSHFSPDEPEPVALAVALHIALGLTYSARSDWAGESQHKEMMAEFGKALELAPDADLANYYYGYGWHSLDPKERANMGSVQQAKAALQKAVLLGKADVKKAARKVLKDLNKPTNKPA